MEREGRRSCLDSLPEADFSPEDELMRPREKEAGSRENLRFRFLFSEETGGLECFDLAPWRSSECRGESVEMEARFEGAVAGCWEEEERKLKRERNLSDWEPMVLARLWPFAG